MSPIETNNTFSQSDKFQMENIKHKIRTVHKKKKRNNYKNIEVLNNIHDDDNDTDVPKKKPIVEGLAVLPIATFKDSDWTEGDNIYEGGSPDRINEKFSLAALINLLYFSYEMLKNNIAYYISYPILKNNLNSDAIKDRLIIKKYLVWFCAISLASISVYNWIYVMLYKEYDARVELYDISRERLHNAGVWGGKIFALLDFLLDIPLFFPEKLQEYFVNSGPERIRSYLNENVFFFFLFLILLIFFSNGGYYIYKLAIDISEVNMSNMILSFLYTTTFLLYVLSFFNFEPIPTVMRLMKLIAGFPASLLVPFISNLFKLFFLLIFSVPIASTLCFIYFILYSWNGIALHAHKDNKLIMLATFIVPIIFSTKINDIKHKIDIYLYSKRLFLKQHTTCDPVTLFDSLKNTLSKILNYICINIITISYIALAVYGIYDFYTNVKDAKLKVIMITFSILFIFIKMKYLLKWILEIENAPNVVEEIPVKGPHDSFSDSLNVDIENITKYLSMFKDMIPDFDELRKNIPDFDELRKKIPNFDDLRKKIPNMSELLKKIQELIKRDALKHGDTIHVVLDQNNNPSLSVSPAASSLSVNPAASSLSVNPTKLQPSKIDK